MFESFDKIRPSSLRSDRPAKITPIRILRSKSLNVKSNKFPVIFSFFYSQGKIYHKKGERIISKPLKFALRRKKSGRSEKSDKSDLDPQLQDFFQKKQKLNFKTLEGFKLTEKTKTSIPLRNRRAKLSAIAVSNKKESISKIVLQSKRNFVSFPYFVKEDEVVIFPDSLERSIHKRQNDDDVDTDEEQVSRGVDNALNNLLAGLNENKISAARQIKRSKVPSKNIVPVEKCEFSEQEKATKDISEADVASPNPLINEFIN